MENDTQACLRCHAVLEDLCDGTQPARRAVEPQRLVALPSNRVESFELPVEQCKQPWAGTGEVPDPEMVAYLQIKRAGSPRNNVLVRKMAYWARQWAEQNRPNWSTVDLCEHLAHSVERVLRPDPLDEAVAKYMVTDPRHEVTVLNRLVEGEVAMKAPFNPWAAVSATATLCVSLPLLRSHPLSALAGLVTGGLVTAGLVAWTRYRVVRVLPSEK